MNRNKQITVARQALLAKFGPHSMYVSEANFIANIGAGLLNDLINEDMADKEFNHKIAILLVGSLACALAMHQFKNANSMKFSTILPMPGNKFSGQNFYPLNWEELLITLDLKSSDTTNLYRLAIQAAGITTFLGGLFFEKEKLIYLFPELQAHLELIPRKLGQSSEEIVFPEQSAAEIAALQAEDFRKRKEVFSKIHATYPRPNTFKFFDFGPQHTERSHAVYNALMRVSDPDLMRKIVNIQLSVLKGKTSDIPLMTELSIKAGLTTRWTSVRSIVNVNKSGKKKAFELVLDAYSKAIDEMYPSVNNLQRSPK